MKEKIIICILLFVVLFYGVSAQQVPPAGPCKIKGRIIDSASGQPVGYATVTAFLNGSSNVAGGIITDDNGQFAIDNLQAGEYSVKIEFIGYDPISKTGIVLTDNKAVANLGNVLLAGSSKKLKEVTVTANRNFMENHLDKLVYNVDKDVTSQGGVATDVLKKVPMISVDMDGNIDLLGDANVRVFINGKPSTMFDNNLAEALKSIPASQIKSIEVITSPGAQYDAQGTGGIINIILKDNRAKGVNGNFSANGGSRYENGTANVHVKNGSLDLNASVTGNMQLNTRTLNNMSRTTDSGALTQDGYGQVQRDGHRAMASFDWAITKNDDINAYGSYNNFGNTNQGLINQEQTSLYPYSDTMTIRNTQNYFRNKSGDWGVNYKKKFAREGQELNLWYQGSLAMSTFRYEQNQLYAPDNTLMSGAKGDNYFNDLESYATVDYSHPFGKEVMLNAGMKGSFSRISSNSDHYGLLTLSDTYVFDPSQQNTFNFNRDIYAAYTTITFRLLKDYSIKLGVRDEYTNNSTTGDTVNIPSYNFVTPSGVISRTFKNQNTVKLSYSRRIQRPGFNQYNPFVNATDPANLSSGSPRILPQKIHSLELSDYKFFDKGSSLLFTLFYRYSVDDWQSFSTYYPTYQVGDSQYRNTTLTATINAGTQQSGGLNVSGTLEATKKLELRCNVSLFEKYIQSPLIAGGTANSFNYRLNLNATYKFNKNLTAEVYGGYNSGTLEAQGKYPSFASYSAAIRQQLWNGKASISCSASDPFNKYTKQVTDIVAVNFSSVSERRYPYQYFSVGFFYKFGKIEFKEKKTGEEEENQTPETKPTTPSP